MIVAFVSLFTKAFGDLNSMVGVMIIVMALMFMGRDMSARPVNGLVWLLVINLSMGICTFVSSQSPYLGLILDFLFIFLTVIVLARDGRSSVEFPFLLGFVLLMSMPVTPEQLPTRMLSLAIGSVFIVALNVLVNRKGKGISGHKGLMILFADLDKIIDRRNRDLAADQTDICEHCLNRLQTDIVSGCAFYRSMIASGKLEVSKDSIEFINSYNQGKYLSNGDDSLVVGLRQLSSIMTESEKILAEYSLKISQGYKAPSVPYREM